MRGHFFRGNQPVTSVYRVCEDFFRLTLRQTKAFDELNERHVGGSLLPSERLYDNAYRMDVNTKCETMRKKVGRPTIEAEAQTHQLQTRVSKQFLAALDDWRRQQEDVPNRTEALRRLTTIALEAEAVKKKGAKK